MKCEIKIFKYILKHDILLLKADLTIEILHHINDNSIPQHICCSAMCCTFSFIVTIVFDSGCRTASRQMVPEDHRFLHL